MGDYLNALSNARGPNGTAEVEKHRNEYIAYGGVTVNPDQTTSVLGKIVSSYDRKTKDALLKQGRRTLDPAPRNMDSVIQNNQKDRYGDYCDVDIDKMAAEANPALLQSSNGYLDASFSYSNGWIGITFGYFYTYEGIFPYIGGGFMLSEPGISAAYTASTSSISTGFTIQGSYALFGGAYNTGISYNSEGEISTFKEVGVSSGPGLALTFTITLPGYSLDTSLDIGE